MPFDFTAYEYIDPAPLILSLRQEKPGPWGPYRDSWPVHTPCGIVMVWIKDGETRFQWTYGRHIHERIVSAEIDGVQAIGAAETFAKDKMAEEAEHLNNLPELIPGYRKRQAKAEAKAGELTEARIENRDAGAMMDQADEPPQTGEDKTASLIGRAGERLRRDRPDLYGMAQVGRAITGDDDGPGDAA